MGNDQNRIEKQAVALKYDSEKDIAPVLIAKGSGYVAENILQKAAENNIPIVENSTVSEVLNTMELGSEIPPDLYQVVAEILAFVSSLDNKYIEYRMKESDGETLRD